MALSSVEDDVLQCTICYETFNIPKTLPCLHTFCEHCLADYIRKGGGVRHSVQQKGFVCPVCREFIPPPDPSKPAAQWAGLFKTNFHLNKIIQAFEEGSISRSKFSSVTCSEHPSNPLDIYCVQCAKAICHLCAGIFHRSCALVVTLEEAADDMRAGLENRKEEMDDALNDSRKVVDSVKKELQRLKAMKENCSQDVHNYADILVQAIRKRETELQTEVNEKCQVLIDKVEVRIDKFRGEQKAYNHNLAGLHQLMKHGTAAEVMSSVSKFKQDSPLSVSSLTSLCDQLKMVDVKFCPAAASNKIISTNLKLGEVHVKQKETNPKEIRAIGKPRPPVHPRASSPGDNHHVTIRSQRTGSVHFSAKNIPAVPNINFQRKPAHVKTIPCKHKDDDQATKLVDVLVMSKIESGIPTDVVLVTDWNNQCVKAFYKARDRDSRLHLGGKPWCITALSQTTVAVSLPLSQRICVLKMGLSMMLLSSVVAEKKYSGLAAIDKNTLVASGGSNPPSVDIINVHGEVLKSLSRDASGSPLFSYPAYVCTTPSGFILVSDRHAGTLTCLKQDGSVVWCFHPRESRQLDSPAGVFCDSHGHVFFVESRGVLMLSANGEYQGVVLKSDDGLDTPKGVCSTADGHLYITNREEEITVFSFNKSR